MVGYVEILFLVVVVAINAFTALRHVAFTAANELLRLQP
jgi:hypothetical protein